MAGCPGTQVPDCRDQRGVLYHRGIPRLGVQNKRDFPAPISLGMGAVQTELDLDPSHRAFRPPPPPIQI